MKFKAKIFQRLKAISHLYFIPLILAVFQFLFTLLLPLILSDVDSGIWLLSLCALGFWLTNYTILKLAYDHSPYRTGFLGWLANAWENIIFIIWLVSGVLLVLLMIKVVPLVFSW